ncbi:MAG: GeoRSP system PqqD family peptide chaperone [Geobacteraceae bacterium]|nr:GeoRSP system PqqD family peptide chaperone [Geobacteraceae bacterium]
MKRIQRNPDILWREEDDAVEEANSLLESGGAADEIGTAILFSDGTMVTLNILGTEIWKRCEGMTVDEIIAELLQEFDVEEPVLRSDVAAFLNELEEKRYIKYV